MPVSRLSPRQLEVARLVADDLTDKEIAAILRLSHHSVRRHLERIKARLGPELDPSKSLRRALRRWIETNAEQVQV